ncbi:hypothetical protein, partial [Roseateles chitosanitabidus]|uniref:hypothetical protein n=1 Tax=Roseateles chitosanitabidus TaxID=65048 RepID=UPI0011DF0C44
MTSILLSQNMSSGSGPGSVANPVRRAVHGPSRAASHAPKRMLDEKGDPRLTQDPSSDSEDPSTEKTDENGAAVLATTSASEQAIAEGITTVAGASGAGATGISLTTVGMGALGLIGLVAAAGGGGNDAKERAQVPQSPGSSSGGDAFPSRVTVPTSDGTPINGQGWVPISGVLPDAEWEYSLDGGKTWHKGHGAGVPASELAEGRNSITVVQTDKSGHRSEPVVVEV